jgi:hypothetical protein
LEQENVSEQSIAGEGRKINQRIEKLVQSILHKKQQKFL